MSVFEIIGVILLIAGILVFQFVGGFAGLIGGIVLAVIGVVLTRFKRRA